MAVLLISQLLHPLQMGIKVQFLQEILDLLGYLIIGLGRSSGNRYRTVTSQTYGLLSLRRCAANFNLSELLQSCRNDAPIWAACGLRTYFSICHYAGGAFGRA